VHHQFVDDQGQPVPNVPWLLLDASGAQVASGSTDDSGHVRVQVDSSADHTLRFDPDTGQDQEEGSSERYDV
jgi:uncharacterized protein YfaS (alpha-2-macroglobulin family)